MDKQKEKYYGLTKSERLSAILAETIFFPPFCFPNPKFGMNAGGELCDCLLLSPAGIVIIQVKESTNDARKKQDSWYKKKIERDAFRQTSTAISAIKEGKPIFDSSKNPIAIDRTLPVHPIIVFDNKKISEYDGFIGENGLSINVFCLEDFETALKGIVTPREFLRYLPWRYSRMKNPNSGEYPIILVDDGIFTPDILKYKDGLNDEKFNVVKYISENYPGHQMDQKDEIAFHGFSKALVDADKNGVFIEYLSAFDYHDISIFWKQWNYAFIDDGKPELEHYGHLSSPVGVDIFIFCKCRENADSLPDAIANKIHRSYQCHAFTEAFILVAARSGQSGKYDIGLTNLDLSIEEKRREFLEIHEKYLDKFLN